MDYQTFLDGKSYGANAGGFEPLWLPGYLKPFQCHLDDWAIRRGSAAIYAACGLGKTPMFLVWAENVVRHTNRPVLVMTTLGDVDQTIREARKFEVDAVRSKDGKFPPGARVVVTNYERLQHFDRDDFSGGVANESSILKNFKGKHKTEVTEFLRVLPYRLLCTATPSPNDYIELGTSSEAIAELGYQDMITRFFVKKLADRGTIGWGRESYRMKGHAQLDFWKWVASWARACRKPSDLGFDDDEFLLPDLVCEQHIVNTSTRASGFLFALPAIGIREQEDELRRTVNERCEKAAQLLDHKESGLAWCNRNPEGKLLAKLIPGAVEVSGEDSDDEKEEKFDAFVRGQIRVIVTKPKIAGFGLNWQHCAHMTCFPSHSWEQWHQLVARCWRYGQKRKVKVDVVATDGLRDVLDNLQNKGQKVEKMFERLVTLMNQCSNIGRTPYNPYPVEIPSWL